MVSHKTTQSVAISTIIKNKGLAGNRTQVTSIRNQCDNHYTTKPVSTHLKQNYLTYKLFNQEKLYDLKRLYVYIMKSVHPQQEYGV